MGQPTAAFADVLTGAVNVVHLHLLTSVAFLSVNQSAAIIRAVGGIESLRRTR
jgi:hypothetical protein